MPKIPKYTKHLTSSLQLIKLRVWPGLFRVFFRSETDPISLLIIFLLVRATSSKNQTFRRFKTNRDGIWQEFSSHIDCRRLDLTSHSQDGGHDVISSRKTVLLPGEWPHTASSQRLRSYAAAPASSYSYLLNRVVINYSTGLKVNC